MKYFNVSTILVPALLVAFLMIPSTAYGGGASLKFVANLSGAQGVPEVFTDTSGDARVKFSDDLSEGEFRLVVLDGVNVIAAHIHCGDAGTAGPVVVTLFAGGPLDVNGELAKDTFDNADLGAAEFCGSNIAALRAAMAQEQTYVNVHTAAIPAGEVRGQLLED